MITRIQDTIPARPARVHRPVRLLLLPQTTSRISAAFMQGYDRNGKPTAPVRLSSVDAKL